MTQKHTPGPWRVRQHPDDVEEFHISALTPEGHPYFGRTTETEIMSDEDYPTKRADADFIVQAVNNHDDLLAACEAALNAVCWDYSEGSLQARTRLSGQLKAAIAEAKGEQL